MITEQSLETIKRWPLGLACFIFLIFLLQLGMSYRDYHRQRTFRIIVKTYTVGYQKFPVKNGYYETGTVGELHLKAKSFKEAFYLNNILPDSLPSYIDLLYALLLCGLLYWITYDLDKDDLFSEKLIKGLGLLRVLFWLYFIFFLFKDIVKNHYIEKLTENKFHGTREHFSVIRVMVGSWVFSLIPQFIIKARAIQKEHNLTV